MAKDDPKDKKPAPKGSNIPTVLGIPAIPDPRIEPKVEAQPAAAAKPAAPPVPPAGRSKPPLPVKKQEPELIEPDPPELAATVVAPPTDPRIQTPPPAFAPALGSSTNIVEAAKKK